VVPSPFTSITTPHHSNPNVFNLSTLRKLLQKVLLKPFHESSTPARVDQMPAEFTLCLGVRAAPYLGRHRHSAITCYEAAMQTGTLQGDFAPKTFARNGS
jgi:hypothetical protein